MIDNQPDSAREPVAHSQEVNTVVTSNVSLDGIGFSGTLAKWFHKFFKRRSETVVTRKPGDQTRLTVTRVSGLTMAHDYLDDAEAYLSAAKKLDEDLSYFYPKYFLLCHAIELALKAHILGHGGTTKQIRDLRHDLVAALKRAMELGFQPCATLNKLVQDVALPHREYSFRYIDNMRSVEKATLFLPNAESFMTTLAELINQVSKALPPHPAVLKIT